jgi:hypothetical protein
LKLPRADYQTGHRGRRQAIICTGIQGSGVRRQATSWGSC